MNIKNNINNELISITDWLKLNKLSLNILKIMFVVFHKAQIKKRPHFKLKLKILL